MPGERCFVILYGIVTNEKRILTITRHIGDITSKRYHSDIKFTQDPGAKIDLGQKDLSGYAR